MNNLLDLAFLPDSSLGSLTIEEEFVKFVYDDLKDIKHRFVDIGFRLREANNLKYYSRLGYDSIDSLAESLFGFKRSTTYSLIAINENFCNSSMSLLPTYDKFSQSQLVELLSVPPLYRSAVVPSMTIADIREFKSYLRSDYSHYYNGSWTAMDYLREYRQNNSNSVVTKVDVQTSGQKCIRCLHLNSADTFCIEDISGNIVYLSGFKYCPYCGRKL